MPELIRWVAEHLSALTYDYMRTKTLCTRSCMKRKEMVNARTNSDGETISERRQRAARVEIARTTLQPRRQARLTDWYVGL